MAEPPRRPPATGTRPPASDRAPAAQAVDVAAQAVDVAARAVDVAARAVDVAARAVDVAALRARWDTPVGRDAWGTLLASLSRGRPRPEAWRGPPGDPALDPAWCDLRGIDLRGADLRGVDLSFARLDHALLEEAQLDGARFVHAVWSGVSGRRLSAVGALLHGLVGVGADLSGSEFTECTLEGANLASASLVRAVFTGARCAGASFAGADLTGADLRGAHLYRCDLEGARLVRARCDADRYRRPDGALVGVPTLGGLLGRVTPLLQLSLAGPLLDQVDDRVGRSRDASAEVSALLGAADWRAQLLGATAALYCPADPWLDERLWAALDGDTWVSPQVAAVLWVRDPLFVERSGARLDPHHFPKRTGALTALCARGAVLDGATRFHIERVQALLLRGRSDDELFPRAAWEALAFGVGHADRWLERLLAAAPQSARGGWVRG